MSEQKYRPLQAGEIISNGDQYLDVCDNWIGYPAHRFGQPISKLATGRRPVAGETWETGETETVEQQEQQWEEVADENYVLRPGVDQCRGRRPNSEWGEWGKWVDFKRNGFPCTIGEWIESSPAYLWEFRRPVEQNEQKEQPVQPDQAADESLPATAESLRASLIDTLRCNAELHKQIGAVTKERDDAITLHAVAESNCRDLLAKYDAAGKELAEIERQRDELQKAYDSCLEESNLIIQDGEKAKAELAASQRMYMEAMTALEREDRQHRETERRLDEVCGERNALQDQLKERACEPSKSEILDFLGVQIAVIPYLQAAVSKDAQRELTIAGRTLQMVHAAIESDRIGREGEGEGKEVDGGKE